MAFYDVQTALVLPEGDTFSNLGLSDEVVELAQPPAEEQVRDDLAELKATRDDGPDAGYRRVFIGQDDDGNFTQILLDVSI